MRSFASSLVAAFLLLASSQASATPLRIWVMHNEPIEVQGPITAGRIQQGIDHWRDCCGIAIENSVQNLALPAETENPLAAYIIGRNQILEELASFRRSEGSAEQIAVEFIRWDDAYNRIATALASSDTDAAPDIVQVGNSWTASFADADAFTDLSGLFDPRDFLAPAVASATLFQHDGLFAAPWFTDVRLLYYRKDQVADPTTLADWGSLEAACGERAAANAGPLIAIPGAPTWNLLHNLSPWIWAAGGGIIEPDNVGPIPAHRVMLDAPASIQAIRFLKGLFASGCIAMPAVTQEIVDRRFLAGEFPAIITGTWILKRMPPDWQERYGVMLPPAGTAGSIPFVGGSHLAIAASSRGRGTFDRAVALVRHFLEPDAQRRYADATGLLPATRAAFDAAGPQDSNPTLFREALEQGRSYPNIPEWGAVVENELIRSRIWHIWRDVAQGASEETLVATAQGAARDLRDKLTVTLAKRSAPALALVLGIAAIGAGAAIAMQRRRAARARRHAEEAEEELAQLAAERTLIQGRALLLERRREESEQEIDALRVERAALHARAAELSEKLAAATARRTNIDAARLKSVGLGYDGTLSHDGDEIRFENNRQARRLFEFLARQAVSGTPQIHCLWGFPLFGWEASLRSDPKRLFEALASKINGRLRAVGLPPIVQKLERRACAWQLRWNRATFLEASAIGRAAREAEQAAAALAEDRAEEACRNAIAALELDPIQLEALAVIRALLDAGSTKAPHNRLEGLLKLGERLVAEELATLRKGIAALESWLTTGKRPRGMDAATAGDELAALKHQAAFVERRFEAIFRKGTATARPLLVEEIAGQMGAVQREIARLRARGVSDELVWASTVDSASFLRLMAIPRIRTLVHNFYNHEIQSCEDPRLVQLALVSLLASPQAVSAASEARDERDILAHLDRGLRKQLVTLEHQLGSMTMM